MAKSIRSKSKRRFRAIKRAEVFQPVEDARLVKLAQLQADAALAPSSHMDTDASADTTLESVQVEERGRSGAPVKTTTDAAATGKMEVDEQLTAAQLKIRRMKLYMSKNQFRRKKRDEKRKALGRKAPKIARKGRRV
ncbi:hypothetical protein SeLEV6574_g00042 [Synchytrium endobioticum]|nr:hypothetical protein SeLEV6574_g00042 [Synchytrium endobioticum]